MSKKVLNQLVEAGVTLLVSVVIYAYFQAFPINHGVELSLIPLILLALRHGTPLAIIVGTLIGICASWLVDGDNTLVGITLNGVLPYVLVGLAGLFAKYTQKTLNNRKLKSTYLNIVTACFLAIFSYYISKFILYPLALNKSLATDFLWRALATFLISISLMMVLAKVKPSTLIPKRSKYLSRKETSKLLND